MNASYTEIIFAGCILILPFLYESSHVFRYHLKFLLYYAIVMINSVILIPAFLFKAGDVRNLLTASAWCHHISTLLGLRWIVRGRENLEKDQAGIIVSNHQSSIDILGLFDIWPIMDKCTVVAKKELLYAWPFGLAAWLCGLIFIPRMNSDKAKMLMNEADSNFFKYVLKFFLFYLTTVTVAGVLIPYFIFRPKDPRNFVCGAVVVRYVSPVIGLEWIIRGQEYLEKQQACVIVANHQSALDILGLFHLWPIMDKCTVVAKKELFYVWPLGLSTWLCGMIFIPRWNTSKCKELMNKAVEWIKKDNIKLWVFPEGTRRNTGQIHPFKKGAFHLAISSKLPILPVVFSQYYFLDKENKRFDHGKVYITALPHISTENMTLDNVEELMEQTRNIMTATFHESNKEIKDSLRPFSSQ